MDFIAQRAANVWWVWQIGARFGEPAVAVRDRQNDVTPRGWRASWCLRLGGMIFVEVIRDGLEFVETGGTSKVDDGFDAGGVDLRDASVSVLGQRLSNVCFVERMFCSFDLTDVVNHCAMSFLVTQRRHQRRDGARKAMNEQAGVLVEGESFLFFCHPSVCNAFAEDAVNGVAVQVCCLVVFASIQIFDENLHGLVEMPRGGPTVLTHRESVG